MKRKIKVILSEESRANLVSVRDTLSEFLTKHGSVIARNEKALAAINECGAQLARLEETGDIYSDEVCDQILRLQLRVRVLEGRMPSLERDERATVGYFRGYMGNACREINIALNETYDHLLSDIAAELKPVFPNAVKAWEVAKMSPVVEAWRQQCPVIAQVSRGYLEWLVRYCDQLLNDALELTLPEEQAPQPAA